MIPANMSRAASDGAVATANFKPVALNKLLETPRINSKRQMI